MYMNNSGHMTKMAAMHIYGKNPSKIFFSGTGGPISTKLGMRHQCLKYYNVYINHDPVMTLTILWQGQHSCPCIRIGKIVQMAFKGKILQEMSSMTEY